VLLHQKRQAEHWDNPQVVRYEGRWKRLTPSTHSSTYLPADNSLLRCILIEECTGRWSKSTRCFTPESLGNDVLVAKGAIGDRFRRLLAQAGYLLTKPRKDNAKTLPQVILAKWSPLSSKSVQKAAQRAHSSADIHH